jgi:hypothetical protein
LNQPPVFSWSIPRLLKKEQQDGLRRGCHWIAVV